MSGLFASRLAAMAKVNAAARGEPAPVVPASATVPATAPVQAPGGANGAAKAAAPLPDAAAFQRAVNNAAPATPPAPPAPTQPTSQPEGCTAPPWTNPGCKACGGVGFNSQNNPCRTCDALAAVKKRPLSSLFTIEPDGEGHAIWTAKDGSGMGVTLLPHAPAEVKVSTPSAQQGPALSPAEKAAVVEAVKTTPLLATDLNSVPDQRTETAAPSSDPHGKITTPPPAPTAETKPRGPGRPPGAKNKPKPSQLAQTPVSNPPMVAAQQVGSPGAPLHFTIPVPEGFKPEESHGLILVVNCNVHAFDLEDVEVVNLGTVFQSLADLYAQSCSLPSYYHAHPFSRRDALAANAMAVAAHNDGKAIMGRADTPDLVAFVAALRPYARVYVEGVV